MMCDKLAALMRKDENQTSRRMRAQILEQARKGT